MKTTSLSPCAPSQFPAISTDSSCAVATHLNPLHPLLIKIEQVIDDLAFFTKLQKSLPAPLSINSRQRLCTYAPSLFIEGIVSAETLIQNALTSCTRRKYQLHDQIHLQKDLQQIPPKIAFTSTERITTPDILKIIFDHLEPDDLITCSHANTTWKEHAAHALFLKERKCTLSALTTLHEGVRSIDSLKLYTLTLEALQEAFDAVANLRYIKSFFAFYRFHEFVLQQVTAALKMLHEKDLSALSSHFFYTKKPAWLMKCIHLAELEKHVDQAVTIANPDERALELYELIDKKRFFQFRSKYGLECAMQIPLAIERTKALSIILNDILVTTGVTQCLKVAQQLMRENPQITMCLPLPLDSALLLEPDKGLLLVQNRLAKNEYANPAQKIHDQYNACIFHYLLGEMDLAFTSGHTIPPSSLVSKQLSHPHWLLIKDLISQNNEKKVHELLNKLSDVDMKHTLIQELQKFHILRGNYNKAFKIFSVFSFTSEQRDAALSRCANLLLPLGEIDRALHIAKSIEDPTELSYIFKEISLAYQRAERLNDSLAVALQMSKEIHWPRIDRCKELCKIFLKKNLYEKAWIVFEEIPSDYLSKKEKLFIEMLFHYRKEEQLPAALQATKQMKDKHFQPKAFKLLFENFFSIKNFDKAQEIAHMIDKNPERSLAFAKLLVHHEFSFSKCKELLPMIQKEHLPEDLQKDVERIMKSIGPV